MTEVDSVTLARMRADQKELTILKRKLLVRRYLFVWPTNVLSLAAGATIVSNITNTPEAVTLFTHLGMRSVGPFQIQITPSDLGGSLFQTPVDADTFLSMLDRPGQFPEPLRQRGAHNLAISITNTHTVAQDIFLSWIGWREFPGPANC